MFVLLTAENTYYSRKETSGFTKNISQAQVFDSLEAAKKEQQTVQKKHQKTTSISTFIH